MLHSLTLENYRGFRKFELHNLGRVNLIVGANNAGKTSVLEAIHILKAKGKIGPIWSILTRRGEDSEERKAGSIIRRVDIRRLFHGHELALGKQIQIRSEIDGGEEQFTASITQSSLITQHATPSLFDLVETGTEIDTEFVPIAGHLALYWQNPHNRENASHFLIKLSRRGEMSSGALRTLLERDVQARPRIHFITAASLSPNTIINSFEEIVLTQYEDFVTESLRIIEPSIERLATSGTERRRVSPSSRVGARGGLVVKCQGIRGRIPIGSMGDGIWRLLGLALSLARTEGGILLVDEIDTGLHYTAMENMWKLVSQTAKNLNIQVFATTHSRDCYESLAAVSRETVSKDSEITIQRIERGKERSVSYSEQEIVAAARRHTEVR